ncbi:MAG: hypothetical protein EAZ61_12115 [Oscillatoriales cyanobacterium]|nr:MAG: hypothetical protein EAZ61_12115 [Oscillatoriales cyanobacterium]
MSLGMLLILTLTTATIFLMMPIVVVCFQTQSFAQTRLIHHSFFEVRKFKTSADYVISKHFLLFHDRLNAVSD